MENIESIKKELESLPKGYISNKMIGGKVRHYLQWSENGKVKSLYIRDSEYETVKAGVERRKELKARLRAYQAAIPKAAPQSLAASMQVITGERLRRMAEEPSKLDTRDCFPNIEKFLRGPSTSRVLVIYGLRRTGKTTLLFQAIGRMDAESRDKTFYLKAQRGQRMSELCRIIDEMYSRGYRYAFLDEITFVEDFIDTAAILSDIYAAMGMKILICGTDSLGLWLAGRNELYDRTFTFHTTRISFAEHARLLHIDDVDDYIRYGGTLRSGEYDFDDPELRDEAVSFRDDESTRRYIDTSICLNIQHSLRCYESGTRFMHLQELYDAGELTNAINRVIEDMNHRFVLSVLQEDFRSGDFERSRKNLLKEKDLSLRTDVLERVNREKITERLMQILSIRNRAGLTTELKQVHVEEIREYLEALDLIERIPVRYAYGASADSESVVITQPGMRYCQAEALVWSLKQDELFAELSEPEKDHVIDRILCEVKGRMLEEIVLSETKRALNMERYDVFKYQFIGGEIDMVVYDRQENNCRLYEIKHAEIPLKEQCRHLLNEEACGKLGRIFGSIVKKAVIYRGQALRAEWGVDYLNAGAFLKDIGCHISQE